MDINLSAISMRLSYRDYMLLLSIAKQVKRSASGEDISVDLSTTLVDSEQKVLFANF